MIPKLLTLTLKASQSMRILSLLIHILTIIIVLMYSVSIIFKLLIIFIILANLYYTDRNLSFFKLLQLSQSGRASVLTQSGEWFLIQILPETFCNHRLIVLNFKYLEEHRTDKRRWFYIKPRRIVLTESIFEEVDQFRHLRILLHQILK